MRQAIEWILKEQDFPLPPLQFKFARLHGYPTAKESEAVAKDNKDFT